MIIRSRPYSTGRGLYDEWQRYRFPAALGFVAIAFVFLRRKERVEVFDENGSSEIIYRRVKWQNLKDLVLINIVPYKTISVLWGKVNNLDIPFDSIRVRLFKLWSNVFSCDVDEIEKDLKSYKNLQQFFTRDLKEGCREIDIDEDTIVAPTDSQVFSFGSLYLDKKGTKEHWSSAKLQQIKGRTYEIEKLLGQFSHFLEQGTKLNYIVFYLSPGDYHHYHAPQDFQVLERRHYPGKLFPVKESFLNKIDNLYGINERVSLLGKWRHGMLAYVAVGACNVGSMTLDFEPELSTNTKKKQKTEVRYIDPVDLRKGQRVGTFNLGSTVVLIFESSEDFEFCVSNKERVKIGQPIGRLSGNGKKSNVIRAPPWPAHVKSTS